MEAFVSIHKLTTMAYDVEKVVRLVLPGKPVIAADDHPDPVLLRRRHDLMHGKSDAIPVNLAPRLYFDTEVSGQAGLGEVRKMCSFGLCQFDLADRRFKVPTDFSYNQTVDHKGRISQDNGPARSLCRRCVL